MRFDTQQANLEAFPQQFAMFLRIVDVADECNLSRRLAMRPLRLTYPVDATDGERRGEKTKKRRAAKHGVSLLVERGRSSRSVVFASQVEKFLLDGFEVVPIVTRRDRAKPFVA